MEQVCVRVCVLGGVALWVRLHYVVKQQRTNRNDTLQVAHLTWSMRNREQLRTLDILLFPIFYDKWYFCLGRFLRILHTGPINGHVMQFPSLNTPADIQLTVTSTVQWAKCGQPLKQINYASTKLLAHVHRAGLALRARHTLPYGMCKNGHGFGKEGGAEVHPWNSHRYLFSAWVTEEQKIHNICCEIPQNESNAMFRWLLLGD